MNKVAVLGQIGIEKYSMSPLIHSEFFKQTNIFGEYTAVPVLPEELDNKLYELQELGFKGVNLTIPHKVNALKCLDFIDDNASKIGAVNTILFKNNKRFGYNTDVFGFMKNLKDWNRRGMVIIFGSGGASRSVICGLQEEGIRDIVLLNRTDENAIKLANEFSCGFELWKNRHNVLNLADLIVNTTPAGMQGNPPLDIDLSSAKSSTIVYDIVYNPLITPLLKQASDFNLKTINGLGMLLYQGAKAFDIWFSKMPEINEGIVNKCKEKLSENS